MLRVALDARIPPNEWGGVQQVVQGLVSGLSRLDLDEQFIVMGYDDAQSWLGPVLGERMRLEVVSRASGRSVPRRVYDVLAGASPSLARAAETIALPIAGAVTHPPGSDGVVERLGVDVVHFLTPGAMLTSIPSIYQPHDLQHVHLPELFSPIRRRNRDAAYRAFAAQAAIVAVMTEWGRDDIVSALGIERRKVAVVPWAPVVGTHANGPDAASIPRPFDRFLLYPAQTWPHKNHIRLLEALAILRARGVRVPLVSTGRQNEHFAKIRGAANRLGLADQLQFLGYVDDAVLGALYRQATALVFPSLFEGWGIPVVEAFAYGLPVAAADATVLPEVTAGAALLFDPLRPESIADALERLWIDDAVREELRRRGAAVAARLDWRTTAATFVALYRTLAGQPLSADDRARLEPPTLAA